MNSKPDLKYQVRAALVRVALIVGSMLLVCVPVFVWAQGNSQGKGASSASVDVQPAQSSMQVGASRTFTVTVDSGRSNAPFTLLLSSSDPRVLSVPEQIALGHGRQMTTFTARAYQPGDAVITLQLVRGIVRDTATVRVRVVPDPPRVVSLIPQSSVLQPGASGRLTVRLAVVQRSATPLKLVARTSGIVSVPPTVIVPAGAIEASVDMQALSAGNTFVAAFVGDSRAEAAVQVQPAPIILSSLMPALSTLTVSAQGQLTVTLSAAPSAATPVTLSAEPAGVVQLPTQVLVPAGQVSATFTLTALKPGTVQLGAALGTYGIRRATLQVIPQPAVLAALTPESVTVQRSASAQLTLRLDAAQAEPVTVTLLAQPPGILSVPASVTVPAGQTEQTFSAQALGAGETALTATLRESQKVTQVRVILPPPQLASLEPATQQLPKGRLGRLVLRLDRVPQADTVVALSSSEDTLVQVPVQVTVPAGQPGVDVPVSARALGEARVQATLHGVGQTTVIQVVDPELVALEVKPAQPLVSPGQRIQLQAQGTYSDTSTREVGADAATAWRSSAPEVAEVDTQGRLTGLKPGTASVSAQQTIAPTWDQPQPPPVVDQAEVTVGEPLALAMATARTALRVDETASVSVTTPYPAAAAPYVLQLSTEGAGALQLPAQVTIGPGLTSATFTVRATAPGAVQVRAVGGPFVPARIAFDVQPALPTRVVISGVEPDRAPVGTLITLTGEGFVLPAAGNTVAFAGNVPAPIESATATSLRVRVPESAQSGPLTVTNAIGSATSGVFTVVREQDFGIQASPSQLRLMQGSNAQASLQLASNGTRAYQGLASLSASGLPAGVSARFEPPLLSAYQTGRLILQADAAAPVGAFDVTVTAQATLEGLPWVRQSRLKVDLISGAGVTGVKGRFVTPEGAGIAGVIVRQDTTTRQVVSDAAGNFLIDGLPSGVTTLRFDATPAHALYPIWPYNVTLEAGQLLTTDDWVISPPPPDERFKPIANATQDQAITDERYPGFAVVLPAGVSITGWDGVKKTRIAVEKITPDRLPVGPPPFAMKEAYQLYFGTPMGGIPSAPIPVQLPNVAEREPGEKVEIWWFDGSPMGGTGEWKVAGLGTVSADGRTVASDPGVGLPRFCGVCGLVSLSCPPLPDSPSPPPIPPEPDPSDNSAPETPSSESCNPVTYTTGQEMPSSGGLRCGGLTPIETGLTYNPVDAFNNRAGTVASFGYGWVSDYDIAFLPFSGPQKRLVMPGARRINFIDDGSGSYRTTEDPRFKGAMFRAEGDGWLLIFRSGARWRFKPFSGITGVIRGGPPMFVTEMHDPAGNVLNITRTTNGRITAVGSSSRSVVFDYGSNGFVSAVRDGQGRTVRYAYNSADRISAITDAEGRTTRYTYLGAGESLPTSHPAESIITTGVCRDEAARPLGMLISKIEYPGRPQLTVNRYGSSGRVLSQTASDGQQLTFEYRVTGACIAHVDHPTARCMGPQCPVADTLQSYQAGWRFYGGRVVGITVRRADGASTSQVFDAEGRPIRYIDARGQTTLYRYDPQGRLVETQDAIGRLWKRIYDDQGDIVQTLDPSGTRREYTWDTRWGKIQTITTFDEAGARRVQQFEYDRTHGGLLRATNEAGLSSYVRYTPRGEIAATGSDLQQPRWQYRYSPVGDLVSVTDGEGGETRLDYDAVGRPTQVTDPLGYTRRRTYSGTDSLTQETDPLDQVSRIEYDSGGRPARVENAAGAPVESYRYDDRGRMVERSDALGAGIRYTYDDLNRLVQQADREGRNTTYRYEPDGRLAEIAYPDATVQGWRYDVLGRLTEVSDPASRRSIDYDDTNRVVRTREESAVGKLETAYTYDRLGRLVATRMMFNGQPVQTERRVWDAAHRLTEHGVRLGSALGQDLQEQVTRYEWNAASQLARRTLPNGIEQRWTYDRAARVTRLQYLRSDGSVLEQIDYAYDAAGRRTARTMLSASSALETPMQARYDAANRLLQLTLHPGTAAERRYRLDYDANGALTLKQRVDASGNPVNEVAQDRTQYVWDVRGRLAQIQQGERAQVVAVFTYDHAGRRISRGIQDAQGQRVTTHYLYQGLQAIAEVREGRVSASLITGLALDDAIARASRVQGLTQMRTYLSDALGSVLAQTTQAQAVDSGYAYSPYGETMELGVDVTGNPIQYTGRENDGSEGTGLYFYRARFYDPVLKRFISRDPIGLAGGMNEYGYVENNPLSMTDSLGLMGQGSGANGQQSRNVPALPPAQAAGATADFWRNYSDMRTANTIGADKYFHCKANCEATRRGRAGESMACRISDTREWFDQTVKGDPASASEADQAANTFGRSHAGTSGTCAVVCGVYRPNGLPSGY